MMGPASFRREENKGFVMLACDRVLRLTVRRATN